MLACLCPAGGTGRHRHKAIDGEIGSREGFATSLGIFDKKIARLHGLTGVDVPGGYWQVTQEAQSLAIMACNHGKPRVVRFAIFRIRRNIHFI